MLGVLPNASVEPWIDSSGVNNLIKTFNSAVCVAGKVFINFYWVKDTWVIFYHYFIDFGWRVSFSYIISIIYRLSRYQAFKNFQKRILVATNLFGRGMDIERVNIVFNYDMPEDSDTYLHRVSFRFLKQDSLCKCLLIIVNCLGKVFCLISKLTFSWKVSLFL